ncbi:hypothetical protein [Mesorhizobium sp.]|nr:hypothetical protein [Mesorhizobium sp.]
MQGLFTEAALRTIVEWLAINIAIQLVIEGIARVVTRVLRRK